MESSWKDSPPYSPSNPNFDSRTSSRRGHENEPTVYHASCHCGRVRYQVLGDPEGTKLCHCRGCQKLHGAPFEWVCIFHKHNVRFDADGPRHLYFYSSELDRGWDTSHDKDIPEERILPVKVSCTHCRTPIADEGRNMWLAYGTLFDFGFGRAIPESFRHSCHLFYGQRCIDLDDDKPKWSGHKNKSVLL